MAYPERTLLGRWKHTGLLAKNTYWSPPPLLATMPNLPQGMLNGKQVGEVEYAVAFSPVSPSGVPDDLQYIQLVLDGKDYPYIWLSGRQDTSMAPPPNRIRRGKLLTFGKPFLGRNGTVAGLLDATCPKFINSATVKAWAGAADVTYDFTVELWGYVYDSVDLAKRVPVYEVPDMTISDVLNGRVFDVVGRTIQSGGDWRSAWASLPSGQQQGLAASTPVFPLVRRARNVNPTAVSTAYVPQYQNSSQTPAVQNPQDNMFFTPNARQALLLKRFGVDGPVAPNATGYDLLTAWIATTAEAQRQHPDGGIPAGYNLGELRFGLSKGETNKFDALPELPQGDQLITDETAYPTFVDNGISVPANAAMMGMSAILLGADDQGI